MIASHQCFCPENPPLMSAPDGTPAELQLTKAPTFVVHTTAAKPAHKMRRCGKQNNVEVRLWLQEPPILTDLLLGNPSQGTSCAGGQEPRASLPWGTQRSTAEHQVRIMKSWRKNFMRGKRRAGPPPWGCCRQRVPRWRLRGQATWHHHRRRAGNQLRAIRHLNDIRRTQKSIFPLIACPSAVRGHESLPCHGWEARWGVLETARTDTGTAHRKTKNNLTVEAIPSVELCVTKPPMSSAELVVTVRV